MDIKRRGLPRPQPDQTDREIRPVPDETNDGHTEVQLLFYSELPHLNRSLRRQLGVDSADELFEKVGSDFEAFSEAVESARARLAGNSAIHGAMQDDRSLTFIPK